MTDAVIFSFTGSFQPESFARFVQDRVLRLGLAAVIRHSSPSGIIVEVAGEPDLIGAFEMACSLGPSDALVHEVAMSAIHQPGMVAT